MNIYIYVYLYVYIYKKIYYLQNYQVLQSDPFEVVLFGPFLGLSDLELVVEKGTLKNQVCNKYMNK